MNEDIEESTILYDIEELVEWPKTKHSTESLITTVKSKPLVTNPISAVSNWGWSALKSVGLPVKRRTICELHNELAKLMNSHDSWTFDISADARFLAILQERFLEIREIRGNSTPVVGKFQFDEESEHLQWRKVKWNKEGSMVAFSVSSGTIYVCDIKGILICKLEPNVESDDENCIATCAVSALIFVEDPKHDMTKLFYITYSGTLTCVEVNADIENGYKKLNSLDVSSHFKYGVTDMVYCQSFDMLVMSGCSDHLPSSTVAKYKKSGLNAWRILSDYPHYKEITLNAENSGGKHRASLLRRLSTVPENLTQRLKGQMADGIFGLSLSPDGSKLFAVHLSGNLSLWKIPSLRQAQLWPFTEQPNFNETDPDVSKEKIKVLREYPLLHNVISSAWWNNNSVILTRCSGNLTIVSANKPMLKNLLGNHCEWLEPAAKVSPAINHTFVSLECSTRITSLKRQVTRDENEDAFDPFLDASDHEDENDGIVKKVSNYSRNVLWNLTEYEFFQPPKKRPKIITKVHKLISFMKTTPENLFNRKIELEEYGAALALAESYNLDSDRVYQRQWENSPVCKASIQDYLRKIKKREWVLKECCNRVPKELDAAKELIKFGLAVTDLEQMNKLQNKNSNNFDISQDNSDVSSDEEYEGFDVEEQRKQEHENRGKYVRRWMKNLDCKNLNLYQENMLRCRRKLFKYMDRVSTLEELLGGYDAARERYDPKMFANFREKNILEITLQYAQKCDWNSVDTLIMFHYDELKEHRLVILSNIPETAMPSAYENLLPRLSVAGNQVEDCESYKHRTAKDWCENTQTFECQTYDVSTEFIEDFYEENDKVVQFRSLEHTPSLVEGWYKQRAYDLEKEARNIEGSLQLLKYAMSNGFTGVGDLRREIGILGTLVFECSWDVGLSLSELQSKTNLQKLEMLLSSSTEEMFIKNVHRWAIPFLNTCEDQTPNSYFNLLDDYLTTLSEENITFPSLILKASIPGKCVDPIIKSEEQMRKVALNCVYAMTDPTQLDLAEAMADCIKNYSDTDIINLRRQLYVCKTVYKQNVKIVPAQIKEMQSDRKQVYKLFVRMSRSAANRQPALKEKDWNELLSDMLDLRNKVFSYTCKIESAVCLEVFVESLLTSGTLNNLKIAAKRMMTSAMEENSVSTFNNPDTITHKLSYENSINLVVKSAQEFFDASSPTADNQMLSIARECLLLISDKPPKVHEFLDLIEGVVLLRQFNVNRLPIQVRLMTDRLSLVEEALDISTDAYKKTDAFLRLAMLLRVYGTNENKRKSKVLIKIVEKALSQQDHTTAVFLCKELVRHSYNDAWKVCLEVAMIGEIDNDVDKKYILTFVAYTCEADQLPVVMKNLNEVNARLIKQKLEHLQEQEEVENFMDAEEPANDDLEQHGDNENSSSKFSSHGVLSATAKGTKTMLSMTGNLLSATGHTTASVLSNTTSKTKEMFSNIQDTLWLKNKISTLTNVVSTDDPTETVLMHLDPFEKQIFNEFYDDGMSMKYFKLGLNLMKYEYSTSDDILLLQAKLHLSVLENIIDNSNEINEELVEELAGKILPLDYAWGIGYLFSLHDLERVENTLSGHSVTALLLQICVYYYSMEFLSAFYNKEPCVNRAIHYQCNPVEIMQYAVEVAKNLDDYETNGNEIMTATNLLKWESKLNDFIQAQKLNDLDRGVNLARFTVDEKYRDETVLGLAMSEDIEHYKLAVSLAERYNADVWEILMTHLEFLFTDCGNMKSSEIKDRIDSLQMIPKLVSQPQQFFQRLDSNIFSLIEGTDYDRLILYFYLLVQCGNEIENCNSKHNLCKMTPNFHVKTLKKIKATCPSVNYRVIITDVFEYETEVDFVSRIFKELDPVLNSQSLSMFAKLMPSIPYNKYKIDTSCLNQHVAKSLMQNAADELDPTDDLGWIKKYEHCSDLLKQLTPHHLLRFAENVLFSHNMHIGHKPRRDIAKSILKLARNQAVLHKKGKLDATLKGENFSEIVPTLQQISRHLDSYTTNFVVELYKSKEDNKVKYFDLYDKSQGKPNEILNLAIEMMEDGCSVLIIKKLFAVSPGNKWKLLDVLANSVSTMFQNFLSEKIKIEDVLQKSDGIASSISGNEKLAGSITSQDIISELRPYCTDSNLPVKLRVDLLKLLEEKFDLEKSDVTLLLFHRTSAIVTSQFDAASTKNLLDSNDPDKISTEENRFEIFMSLTNTEDISAEQLEAVISLIRMWPKFSTKYYSKVWKTLLNLLCSSNTRSKNIIELIKLEPDICLPVIIEPTIDILVQNRFVLSALKIILISKNPHYNEKIRDIMKSVETIGPGICDSELLNLLLDGKIGHLTIGTKFYPCLTEYVLSEDCENVEEKVYELVRKLQDMGHAPEAGTLLLNFKGCPPAMRTFGTAMSYLASWISR